jgi:formylglycine-generating enzyme required for sulfatase activity
MTENQSFREPQCVLIGSGEFLMGCDTGRDEEKPVHLVAVAAFEMAVYQVRNRDYREFLNGTGHPEPHHWGEPDFNHPGQPVVTVSWYDAVSYCEWLSALSGRCYRLPTEAEWEKASLGGRSRALYPWGDELPENHREYRERWGGTTTGPLPVGLGSPNPYGLYDVSENVHEWCLDWFSREYYAASASHNPGGPPSGERKSSRGGSWRHHVKVSRCAARSSIPPHFEYADYGFRVVREVGASTGCNDKLAARA